MFDRGTFDQITFDQTSVTIVRITELYRPFTRERRAMRSMRMPIMRTFRR